MMISSTSLTLSIKFLIFFYHDDSVFLILLWIAKTVFWFL